MGAGVRRYCPSHSRRSWDPEALLQTAGLSPGLPGQPDTGVFELFGPGNDGGEQSTHLTQWDYNMAKK